MYKQSANSGSKEGNVRDSSIETVIQSEAAKKLRAIMLGKYSPSHLFVKRTKRGLLSVRKLKSNKKLQLSEIVKLTVEELFFHENGTAKHS
tara:strand:+ start:118 stop:390 length:273 start_codon:yes stop_codon:yes gene_type:complete